MRISCRDRWIPILSGLLSIIAGLLLVAWSQYRAPGFTPDEPADWVRALCAAIGALTACLGVCTLLLARRPSDRRPRYVTQKTDSGILRIAVSALEHLTLKCVELHEEMRLTSMAIHSARGGVVVDLAISLAANISIPLAVAALQKQIKQYLAASSGVEVKEVRVSVVAAEDTWEASASCGEDTAQGGEESGAASDRRPLHQRIFGQAEEPAILPEPPVETASGQPPTEAVDADEGESAAPPAETSPENHEPQEASEGGCSP